MPAKKINPKKVLIGSLIVGAPIGATLGIVYGTKDKVTEREKLPVVTFGDKYFNAKIKGDASFAPSHVLSPHNGNNLYASYVDLLASSDIEHYTKLIKHKSVENGGGQEAPLYSYDIDITDMDNIEEMNAKFVEINGNLEKLASEKKDKNLGIVTAPLIKDKKRVIQVAVYELETNNDLNIAAAGYLNSHLDFDVNDPAGSLSKFIKNVDDKAGTDGFKWSKSFVQVVLSKTFANNYYFQNFGMKNGFLATGDNEIKEYRLRYSLVKGKKVPVKYKDADGEHFIITTSAFDPADKLDSKALIDDGTSLPDTDALFDGQIRNSNGDYDFDAWIELSKAMIDKHVIVQMESSIDWKTNEWFVRATFNKINSDSVINHVSSLDSVKNPGAISFETVRVPLSHLGKPSGTSKNAAAITVENLIDYDNVVKNDLKGAIPTIDGKKESEFEFNANPELRSAVTKEISSLKGSTTEESQKNLYELIRNAFLGEPGKPMDPQFSHYIKRNLISDGLSILGKVMPGILGPIDSFKAVLKMIDVQKTSLEIITVNGVKYQGEDYLRKVVFSDANIESMLGAMEADGSSVNGLAFVYKSIIQFGIMEQRTPGVLSQGDKNENGARFIVDSSNDWLWSSITKITELSATMNPDKYSLYNLYSLFSGLNIIDNKVLEVFENDGIKQTSEVDNGDSVISTLFDWANENKVLPEGTSIQSVIADVTGTIKKLIINLYNKNVQAREDEANMLPISQRQKFVAFPKSIIEKVITLIPGVDWTEIQKAETKEQQQGFVDFINFASEKDNVGELQGDALKEFATFEFNTLKSENIALPDSLKLPSVTFNSETDGDAKQKLRLFITKVSEGKYLDKLSMSGSFGLALELKTLFKTYDQTVLKGYVIPNKLPTIDPQGDVRKAAVSILGDPYTLISVIDTVKGSEMSIEGFMDKLLPDSSLNVARMIPTLLEALTSKHNLDILSIDKVLNVISRMGLLPSIVDKIISPSVVSTASSLIGDGSAKGMYEAFKVIYAKGLYTYFNDANGLDEFEKDIQPVVKPFMSKLRLITESQYSSLSDEDKKTSVTDKQFEAAIFNILNHGLGDASNKITDSLTLIGKVISNTLELPSSMIDIPKLVEAITGIVEDGSIKASLATSISNTDPKNPTAFQYLFDMLHDGGSTIIYNMLPDKLKTAMDAYPTEELMKITQNLLYGFKTESEFKQFLTFVKGLLPKDDSGKTILDKKLSELDDSVPSVVDIATTDSVEQLLVKAYNGEALINLGDFGKNEISKPISEVLHKGLISDPAKIASDIYSVLHSNAPVKLLFITVYHLKIWDLLPENLKTMISGVLGDHGKNLEAILQVAKDAIENPLNEITSDNVEKILDVVKVFVPKLDISQDLINGIFTLIHNGLNVGAGKSGAFEASLEVDKILGAINSMVSIPDMLKAPIKNFLIGKDTLATMTDQMATDIDTTLKNNPFAKIKHTTGEFAEIKTEIDDYNNLVDSIDSYRDMASSIDALKALTPQKLASAKVGIAGLVSKLNAQKTKTEADINAQNNGKTDISDLLSQIKKVTDVDLIKISDSQPSLLTGTYTSLDGKEHKYSEFNTYEVAQWAAIKAKVEALKKAPVDTLVKIKDIKAQLAKVLTDVTTISKVPNNFNQSIQKALDAYTDYQAWLKDTSTTGGAYVESRITDSGYDAIYNYFKAQADKLKSAITAGNVLVNEQAAKDAFAKFNEMVKNHKAVSTDETESINKAFEGLSSDDIKGVFSSASSDSQKALFSKLSDDNKAIAINSVSSSVLKDLMPTLSTTFKTKLLSTLQIKESKIDAGLPGIDQNTLNQLKGKTIDWLLDNVRVGTKKGGLFGWGHRYVGIDLFNQNTGNSGDSDVKAIPFSPLRSWSYSSSGTRTIKDVNGNDGWSPDWGYIYILKNGNNGSNYDKPSSSHHEFLTFLQHVYSKDINWLIDNGWI